MLLKYVVDMESDKKTVKHILKTKLNLSERLVKKLKYENRIFCNSIPVYVNALVKTNDVVTAHIDFVEESNDVIPQEIDIDILFEDDCLIVLNKQPGIVVHPTSSHQSGTIANAIMFHLNKQGVSKKVRPVSRLDRDTSGIIIFAKNQFVQEALIRQMNDKTFAKEYIGVVHGIVQEAEGVIDLPIDRKPGSIMERHISETGYPSITHYRLIECFDNASYMSFTLKTGRTHQIRVHCQAIGHSLLGDTLYSDIKTELINRQALHSSYVKFKHPYTNDFMELTAPIPGDINQLLEILRK